jgi:hypothetical protein
MNSFYLWYSGLDDIDELKALDPAEAIKIVNAAEPADKDATFWDQTSPRALLRALYVIVALGLFVTAVVAVGLGALFRALLIIAALFLKPYAHRKHMDRLRPRIYEALKARQGTAISRSMPA